jgi:uncharacterized protein
MIVCLISDSHDNHELTKQAVSEAIERGAEAILHCGDVVAANTLTVLFEFDIPIHVVHGNNTGDLFVFNRLSADPANKLHYYGQDADIELAGKRIFLVHYPHYAQGLALTGKWDIVCCGHNHKAEVSQVKNILGTTTYLLNPGTVGGIKKPARYIMGDLSTMDFQIIDL